MFWLPRASNVKVTIITIYKKYVKLNPMNRDESGLQGIEKQTRLLFGLPFENNYGNTRI